MNRMLRLAQSMGMACALLALTGLAMAQTPSSQSPGKAIGAISKAPRPAKVELLDLNFATKGQLQKLPGIDEQYAQKIIDGRPYKTETDLVSRNVISQAMYDKIASMIIVKYIGASPAAKAQASKSKGK
jgi:competence protein ComEA